MRLKPSVRDLITVGCVIIGSLLCAININTFINAGGLFPGGFTGLTVFIQRCAEKYMNLQVPYSAVNFALNAIPAYIGYKTVGKKFTLYSVMIVLTGVFAEILPVTNITEDILLITIFGGILQGVALGIALRGNASSGGTDFIAMWISQRTNQPAWNYILGYECRNACGCRISVRMECCAVFHNLSVLLHTGYQFVHTRYKRMTLFIVTSNPDIVIEKFRISTTSRRNAAGGIGTYYGRPRTMLHTVVDLRMSRGCHPNP